MYRPDSDLHYKYNKQTSFSRTSIFWNFFRLCGVTHRKTLQHRIDNQKRKNRKMVTQNISILLNNLIKKRNA